MSKFFLKTSMGILAGLGLAFGVRAAAPVLKPLQGQVPAVVSQLASVGQLPATNILHLSIGLPLRNQEALTNLLRDLYNPASSNYHHFLTPDEFAAQFGPTPEQYQSVIDFVQSNGLAVTHLHSNRMVLGISGKASVVQNSFHVTLKEYRHPFQARNFYAPDTEPLVNSNLAVLAIQGLDNYVQPKPMLSRAPAGSVVPASGSGPGGGYLGRDFRNAYAPGSALNGSGQIVGLLQFDGYYASDIAAYLSLAGQTNVPLENVLLDGFNGTPGANNDEVCLDIETAIAMAPALDKVVVFEAGPFGNPNDILSSMAARPEIKQFSASWGYSTDATTEQLYQQLAVQGQTFFNASGDGDAWVGSIPYGSCEDPNITIVGGTTLTMSGLGQTYSTEKAWNWGFAGGYNWNPDGYVGTSGGISTDVAIPAWQQGIDMTNNQGSTTMRNVPDVALTGDNVFVVSSGGSQGIFGGTSCASPLWAGFMALVNQQAALNGRAPVGFLAPAVYALAKTASYTNIFHDTMAGDNTWDQSPAKFFAVPGYDLCTGLGTPNGTNFINALAGATNNVTSPTIPAPKGPWGANLSVMNGTDPNGPWFLFVQDDQAINSGLISGGWFITLTTANPTGNDADNQLYMTPSSQAITLGNPWNCVLAVTNYGPGDASNVKVTDTLPSGLPVSSLQASVGSVSQVGSSLVWNVGGLSANNGATLALTFQPGVTGIYTNSAVVASDADPNPDDDSAGASVVVNSATPPVLSAVSLTGGSGGFQFTVSGSTGSAVVEASTNLVNWIPVYTNLIPFTFTNTDSANFPMRFYRVVQ